MTSRHYAGIYPRWNDQIQTLNEAYTGYEYRQAHGFFAGVWNTLTKPAAMGTLHSLWAMLVFEVAGEPSRTAALAVNMLLFLAWQAALVGALRQGRPGRAAIDVFEDEPVLGAQHPLLAMDNVLCTPHLGYVERRTYEMYLGTAFGNVAAFAAGQPQIGRAHV